MNDLLKKLESIKYRYDEVSQLIVDPNVISDMKRYVKLNKEYKDLQEIVDVYLVYKNVVDNIESSKLVIESEEDAELKEMAREELDELIPKKASMEEDIKVLLIPKDPEDGKNVIVELRAGTGGDESCIFVEDIFRMYTMYFKNMGWTFEVVNSTAGTVAGYREIVMEVNGESVYGTMKFESGVHRVQRVPETESQGRVHTSAITVAVLPEAEDVDFELNMTDVKKRHVQGFWSWRSAR